MSTVTSTSICVLLLTTTSLSAGADTVAKEKPAQGPSNETSETKGDTLQEIIVTGTSTARTSLDSPLTVATLDVDDLQKLTASSQADILGTIPGIAAQGGGGEVATNILPRGLPSTGQMQFTPLEYDGIPAFSSNGLNSTDFDVYMRNDLGIARLEYVNGGVSNLFGAGSVAGIFNYISVTGTPTASGTLQLELADENRFRSDFAVSGPISESDFYALSGYYRYDEGPLYSGLPSNGGQFRGNWKHELAEGGTITVYTQLIDDRVQFYADMPLSQSVQTRLLGNNERPVYTANTVEAQGLTTVTPDGHFKSDIADGVSTSGGLLAVAIDRRLGGDWRFNLKTKYAKYQTAFNWTPGGDGVANAPETLQQFLNDPGRGKYGACGCSLALPGQTLVAGDNALFTFADSGQPVPPNYLLYGNEAITRIRPATDFTFETSAAKSFLFGDVHNTLTLGVYGARAVAGDFEYGQDYLADFENKARLVNVTIQDPGGVTRTVSYNGLLSNVFYRNWEQSAIHEAFYAANQMNAERWSLDYGARVERYMGTADREKTSTYTLNNGPPPSAMQVDNPLLDLVPWGNGGWQHGTVARTAWGAAIAGMYRLSDQVRLYANVNRGYFFPELRNINFNPLTGQLESYDAEIIRQTELGIKLRVGEFAGTIAGFANDLKNRRSVNTDLFGNEIVTQQANQAVGGYAEGHYNIGGHISIDANATFTKQNVTQTSNPVTTPVGAQTPQEPAWLGNVGMTYNDGRLDFWVMDSYEGKAWADTHNTVSLPAWSVVRLGGGYTISLAGAQSFRVSFDVYNLLDSQGVTEGSLHIASVTQGGYFIGRTIMPRRIMARLAYKF